MATLGGNLCQQTRCLYYNQRHEFQFVEPCFKRGGNFCYFLPKSKKCWAVFMSDLAPVLVSLDAEVTIANEEATRRIPLQTLYTGDAVHPLQLGVSDILTHIRIPETGDHRFNAFSKLTLRGGLEFAVVNVSADLRMDPDRRTCVEARIAAGAVGPAPVRAVEAESRLAGRRLTSERIDEISRIVGKELHPIPHHGFSRPYLTEALRVQTRKALTTVERRIQRNTGRPQ
jgi:CO/xanthine dehydrogenase FAD-binding subunit